MYKQPSCIWMWGKDGVIYVWKLCVSSPQLLLLWLYILPLYALRSSYKKWLVISQMQRFSPPPSELGELAYGCQGSLYVSPTGWSLSLSCLRLSSTPAGPCLTGCPLSVLSSHPAHTTITALPSLSTIMLKFTSFSPRPETVFHLWSLSVRTMFP